MVYEVVKTIDGRKYRYRVRSVREGKRVRQVFVSYLGPVDPIYGEGGGFPGFKEYEGRKIAYYVSLNGGKTHVWVEEGVPSREIDDITASFDRLPPRMQARVREIQVLYGKGEEFETRGGGQAVKIREEGGTYHGGSHAIRIFTGGPSDRRWVADFRSADYIVSHEAGHAIYGDYQGEEGKLRSAAAHSFDYGGRTIALRAERDAATESVRVKYAERVRKAEARLEGAEGSYAANLNSRLDAPYPSAYRDRLSAERPGLVKERGIAKAALTKIYRNKERGVKAIPLFQDRLEAEYVAVQDAASRKWETLRPANAAMRAFENASFKEQGITEYSDSYRADEQMYNSIFYNENFAEAVKVWLSTAIPETQGAELAKKNPETFKAWVGVMDREGVGSAIYKERRARFLKDV